LKAIGGEYALLLGMGWVWWGGLCLRGRRAILVGGKERYVGSQRREERVCRLMVATEIQQ